MEAALGVRLFVRTNRRLLLTKAGRTLLPRAQRWVSLDPPVIETFAFVTRRGAVPTAAASVLMDLTRTLLADLPGR
jgi:DNA-binding transcriptional LysR family regulator